MRQPLKLALAPILAFALTAAAGDARSIDRPTSSANAPTSTPPSGSVTIYRDEWGVPHIYAAREEDGFFGEGYALADDGLDAILRAFLEASGKAAGAFGPDAVPSDEQAAMWRIAEEAQAGFDRLPAQIQADHRGFVAGIRRFMRAHPERTPPWAPALQDWMPTAVSHGMNVFISIYHARQGFADCRLPPAAAKAQLTPQARVAARVRAQASNQWVLAPRLTKGHATLVWADSHSDFGSARHEVRIHAGAFQAAGIVPAGEVFPLIGHNHDVAWSFTVGGPDTSDCFRLQMEADGETYRYGGETRRLASRDVDIALLGGAVHRSHLRFREQDGRLDPIIKVQDGAAYAVATAYAGAADAYERQIYAMNRAGSIAEFARAQEESGLFPENVMAGDRFGQTYYISVGRVPRRDPSFDWSGPVSGNDPRSAWRGLHPAGDLVQLRNPQEGWMQNSNIAPDTMLLRQAINAGAYPRYIFNDQPGRTGDRAERAKQLLSHATGVDAPRAVQMGMDEYWLRTPRWQAALRAALHGKTLTAEAANVGETLLAFDGVARRDSLPAFKWSVWRLAVSEALLARHIDPVATSRAIAEGAPLTGDVEQALVSALAATPELARKRFGKADRPLGDVFRIGRGGVDLPIGGVNVLGANPAEQTLRAFSGPTVAGGREYRAAFGQRHPMLTIFSDPLQSFSSVPWGQSELPSSRHHSDQSILASEGRLKPVRFSWDDLRSHVTSTLTLKVASKTDE